MCGRYSLYESMDFYLRQLALDKVVINGYDDERINRYNVAPRSRVELIRPVQGGLSIDRVTWGWAPHWANGKGPVPINARGETVLSGRFFKSLWPHGRVLAPANGWFEWVADPAGGKGKQAYYIRAANDEPLFFAALAQVSNDPEQRKRDGFVILTGAADEGLLDVHDRKPLVLTPTLAREWLDPATPAHRAEMIVREGCRRATDFTWHPVGSAVGNVRNEGAALIQRVALKGEPSQGQQTVNTPGRTSG
ncbi:SOS response-associated peptidase family protein [Pseudomonas sp. RP23018S]|uniref:SOS response-associated peptidase family protein n=1 Tax=Pseudomonas sp. RP23018S TaxID=3096037 RepID=UPI002ACAB81F|nr:SOS response-associated peptidase family protein [Pseudomonas sp. RP23018S]MDZ5601852.1 SOS response-associated peptidase family protein [Pseudomonas sp. RP23018S]